jgi:hypothetical protein
MPLIMPRVRDKQVAQHRTRLDRENNETLYAYAHFPGESAEYVLNEVIDTVFARDKEFVQWRALHSQSFVPPPAGRQRPSRSGAARPEAGHDAAVGAGQATALR